MQLNSQIQATANSTLYDTDLSAWAAHNAGLLRAKKFSDLDAEHLIEELDDMGKSEFRAFEGHLQNLMSYLLKWQLQPLIRSGSWRGTIENARHSTAKFLRDNSSFIARLQQTITDEYLYARRSASYDAGLQLDAFPLTCAYSAEQLFDETWFS